MQARQQSAFQRLVNHGGNVLPPVCRRVAARKGNAMRGFDIARIDVNGVQHAELPSAPDRPLQARLTEDAFHGVLGQVFFGVRHRDLARPGGVLELMVRPQDVRQEATVCLDFLDDVLAIHVMCVTLNTRQGIAYFCAADYRHSPKCCLRNLRLCPSR